MLEKCNGCASNKHLTLKHVLKYKVGGLMTYRHNGFCNSLAFMDTHSFYYYYIHNKPIIHSSQGG